MRRNNKMTKKLQEAVKENVKDTRIAEAGDNHQKWLDKAHKYGKKLEKLSFEISKVFPEIEEHKYTEAEELGVDYGEAVEECLANAVSDNPKENRNETPSGIDIINANLHLNDLKEQQNSTVYPLLLSEIYLERGDKKYAIKILDRCFSTLKRLNDKKTLESVLEYRNKTIQISRKFLELGEKEKSEEFLRTFYPNYEDLDDLVRANIFSKLGRKKGIKKYLEKVIEDVEKEKISKHTGDYHNERSLKHNLNDLALELGDIDLINKTRNYIDFTEEDRHFSLRWFSYYERLKRNGLDDSEFLREMLNVAEKQGPYDTAYVISKLFDDERSCERFIGLDKKLNPVKKALCETDISSDSFKHRNYLRLYDITSTNLFTKNKEFMKILLENSYFREKFKSELDLSKKKSEFNIEGWFLLGDKKGIEDWLSIEEEGCLDSIEHFNKQFQKGYLSSNPRLRDNKYENKLQGYSCMTGEHSVLASTMLFGYKLLQNLENKNINLEYLNDISSSCFFSYLV